MRVFLAFAKKYEALESATAAPKTWAIELLDKISTAEAFSASFISYVLLNKFFKKQKHGAEMLWREYLE